jgi:hypothetical protein
MKNTPDIYLKIWEMKCLKIVDSNILFTEDMEHTDLLIEAGLFG